MSSPHRNEHGQKSTNVSQRTVDATSPQGIESALPATFTHYRSRPELTPPALVQQIQRTVGNRATQEFLRGNRPTPEVQRRAEGGIFAAQGGVVDSSISQTIQRKRNHGKRLDPALRQPMEQHAHVNLEHVSIHTDSEADRLSRALDAKAFTVGSDLFFRKGQFNGNSSTGRHLLNHELTHVIQQGGATPGVSGPGLSSPGLSAQRQPMIQRYSIVEPTQVGMTPVTARSNQKEIDQEGGKFNYTLQSTDNVGLKVSNDKKMAVPNVPEQKDFYATKEIIDEGNTVLANQNSIVSLTETGPTIQVPEGGEPLRHIQPSSTRGTSPIMGALAMIEERCIEMAHQTSFGKGMGNNAFGMLNKDNLKTNIVHSDVKNMRSLGNLTDEQSEELGVNQYVMPNVGDMLATYTAVAAPDKWEYHYASVIGRSGSDYVTLENFNRMPEVTTILTQLWETLKDLGDNQELYQEKYQELLDGYGEETDPAFLHEKTIDQVLRYLNKAAEESGIAQDAITNALDDEARMALWYFAMYGKHDQKVQNEDGEESIQDQSFHQAMVSTSDFNKPITMRLRTAPTTQGIDPRTLNIEEPPQITSTGSKIGGFFRNKFTQTGRMEDRVKNAARTLAMADVVRPADLEELGQQTQGDSRTLAKSRYVLQVLWLRVAMDSKSTEVLGKHAQSISTPPMDMAPVITQLTNEVDFYNTQFTKVAGQTEYQKVFTGNANTKMRASKDTMVKSMRALTMLPHWKDAPHSDENYQDVAKSTLKTIHENPDLLDTIEYGPLLGMLEHSQFEYSSEDMEIDQSITGIYQSPQYTARIQSESAKNGKELIETLHRLKSSGLSTMLDSSRFFALLAKEEQVLRACIDLANQGRDVVDPETGRQVEGLIAETQFRVSLLMKAFEEAHGEDAQSLLDDAMGEEGAFAFYGDLGNVGAFLTNVRKRERKLSSKNRTDRHQKIDHFLNLSLQLTSNYAELLEQARLEDTASVFEELLKAQSA